MIDHTRPPEPMTPAEAARRLNLADDQDLLADAIDAVQRLGAGLATATVHLNMAEQSAAEMATCEAAPAWGPSSTPPWNPNPGIEGRVTLGEAVGQALGSASMAWTPRPDGVFDSQDAMIRVYEGIMAWLSDWLHEQVKQANEATAAKLIEQVKKHREGYGKFGGTWVAMNDLVTILEGE